MTTLLLAFIIDIRIHITIEREPVKPQPKAAVKQAEKPKAKESPWLSEKERARRYNDPSVEAMREWDRKERDALRVGGY